MFNFHVAIQAEVSRPMLPATPQMAIANGCFCLLIGSLFVACLRRQYLQQQSSQMEAYRVYLEQLWRSR